MSDKNKDKDYNIHLKGYIYDSLMYRYQLALYKACELDAMNLMIEQRIGKPEAKAKAMARYNRDLMRFSDILNEAMGEHD